MSLEQRAASRGRAQSLVEFAVVVPIFLLLLFALIDFARLEFSYISLANAAREMARSAAIEPLSASAADVATSSTTVDQSFKNFEAFLLSSMNPATDSVTITVADRVCTASMSAGNPCVFPHLPTTSGPCPLPLNPATCAVPTRFALSGGSVNVAATFQFTFSPLFQNRLTGIVDAALTQQFAVLNTAARAYIE
jgi:Flp pilus assembly protein TadG